MPREQWLSGWKQRLLACPHYHVIFTTPHDLNPLWQYNRRRFADALFAAASGALMKLLGDDKYLGAIPGLLAALHTWSQTLSCHVHLHVLVTAGGLGPDGLWRVCKKSCLLPRKVLMIIFRGKLRAELLRALERGELQLPPSLSKAQARGLLNRLGRTVWNVKILDRYDHGQGVITYLARYLKGGPIAPRRFMSVTNTHVRFRCRRGPGEASGGDVKLTVDQFMARLLNHVPPRSMQTVRGYGLYAGASRKQLDTARTCLGQQRLPSKPPPRLNWIDLCIAIGRADVTRCRRCHAKLVIGEPIAHVRPPPPKSESCRANSNA